MTLFSSLVLMCTIRLLNDVNIGHSQYQPTAMGEHGSNPGALILPCKRIPSSTTVTADPSKATTTLCMTSLHWY